MANPLLAHTRTGSSKAGPQTARLVPCAKSQHHGHHPENESCGTCPPPVAPSSRNLTAWINLPTRWHFKPQTGKHTMFKGASVLPGETDVTQAEYEAGKWYVSVRARGAYAHDALTYQHKMGQADYTKL